MSENKKIIEYIILFKKDIIFPLMTRSFVFRNFNNLKVLKDIDISKDKVLVCFEEVNGSVKLGKTKVHNYGVICDVKTVFNVNQKEMRSELTGKYTVNINSIKKQDSKFEVNHAETAEFKDSEADMSAAFNTIATFTGANKSPDFERMFGFINMKSIFSVIKTQDPTLVYELVNNLVGGLAVPSSKVLKYLSIEKIVDKVEELILDVKGLLEMMKIEKDLQDKIKVKLDNQQQDYYLKEKMNALQEQMNEGEPDEVEAMAKDFEEKEYPEKVKEKMKREIKRYKTTPTAAAESGVLRNYIEWMHDLPWWQKSTKEIDLDEVKKSLDQNHYSLNKVKDRIVEYLAVKKKTDKLKGPIICLVGPPGVGKTSLAYSIASAIGRKFQKISMGGVKDESEVRGHRRTYVGAMPGRFIAAMKKSGVTNPLILIDEIDKMASDWKGDPSSAMLEVLDPEQNKDFSDNYIEETYDLSNVMFVATANYIENIPPALKDRLEIIQLSSYTEQEKVKIATAHLIPKIIKTYELNDDEFSFAQEDLMFIIQRYTREAGVRELERVLNKIARKIVVSSFKIGYKPPVLNEETIIKYLSKPKYDHTKKADIAEIGVVSGLAYTQFGGDILPIEVNVVPGKGKLVLTGKLGDVMKESAQIALSYVKSVAPNIGIKEEIFEKNDFHIHAPEGAVPKDGPSAGITIITTLISALTKQPVSNELGMTGEVTLRGNVLPIGGLKEKSISAHRSGLKRIIVPSENEKDLEDIPKEVQQELKINFAKTYPDVYKLVFGKEMFKNSFKKGVKLKTIIKPTSRASVKPIAKSAIKAAPKKNVKLKKQTITKKK